MASYRAEHQYIASLEAHVAALAQELRALVNREDEQHRIWAIIGTVAFERIKALLESPDIAALVRRQEAVEKVEGAARNVEWADHDHYQRNPRAHMKYLREALTELAALDAGRSEPSCESHATAEQIRATGDAYIKRAKGRAEQPRCADAQLPDGPVCPACGGPRAPSGVDGGSWVHFPRAEK
jgi:hypothetical protein